MKLKGSAFPFDGDRYDLSFGDYNGLGVEGDIPRDVLNDFQKPKSSGNYGFDTRLDIETAWILTSFNAALACKLILSAINFESDPTFDTRHLQSDMYVILRNGGDHRNFLLALDSDEDIKKFVRRRIKRLNFEVNQVYLSKQQHMLIQFVQELLQHKQHVYLTYGVTGGACGGSHWAPGRCHICITPERVLAKR